MVNHRVDASHGETRDENPSIRELDSFPMEPKAIGEELQKLRDTGDRIVTVLRTVWAEKTPAFRSPSGNT